MSEALKEARKQMIDNSWASGSCEAPVVTLTDALGVLEKLEAALSRSAGPDEDTQMLYRIRASLEARSEGRNEGGDIEVMKHVDAIVARENSRSAPDREAEASICGNSCVLKSNHEGPCKPLDDATLAESPSESAPAPEGGDERVKKLSDLLCPVHANLDKNDHLEPFDNCIAYIRVERDELNQLIQRISTDIAQTIIEDPIKSAEGWVMMSQPILKDIQAVCEGLHKIALAKLPAPEGMGRDAGQCSCDAPHPAHTYGIPTILCKGIPKPGCDGSVIRATGQCNQCLAYHVAHPTSESGTDEAMQMLNRIRGTLKARAEGHNEGGDIEVMKYVDAIVKAESGREGYER